MSRRFEWKSELDGLAAEGDVTTWRDQLPEGLTRTLRRPLSQLRERESKMSGPMLRSLVHRIAALDDEM